MIILFFCKQKTAYEMRISDWSSDVCSSDLTDAWNHGKALDETDPYRAAQRDFSNAVNIRALYEPLDHQDRDSSNDQRDRHHPGRAEQRLDLVMQYRSEEHTSELQSLMRISYAVFCLKKKKKQKPPHNTTL